MSLVEDSYYTHDQYGRVRLVSIDADADEVLFECESEPETVVTGLGAIPTGARESIAAFETQTDPAPITITPPSVDVDADSSDL